MIHLFNIYGEFLSKNLFLSIIIFALFTELVYYIILKWGQPTNYKKKDLLPLSIMLKLGSVWIVLVVLVVIISSIELGFWIAENFKDFAWAVGCFLAIFAFFWANYEITRRNVKVKNERRKRKK